MDEDTPLIKAEFVWADGADKEVMLVGAWNDWTPVKMYREGGEVELNFYTS